MTTVEIGEAIIQHDKAINYYQSRVDAMRPAFMYDYDVIDKLENILRDTIACRDMLSEMLKDGET